MSRYNEVPTSQELAGKTALVTGGGRNIGRAIALELARAGAHIAIVTRADRAAGDAVAKAARRLGVDAECYVADVTNETAVRQSMVEVDRRFGRLDILVNNAALRSEVPFAELSLDQWHAILAVTLDGAFLCAREALPRLATSDGGAIVNIGGLTAFTGAANRAHVVTAKAGLVGLTRALAIELAPQSITVNLVSPGLIETVRDGAAPRHHGSHATLFGRRGEPDEVAAAVRYLAGPGARYVTGQTLHVNGGAYLG
jgi:3-oxoacyl-[acyl-carrier protein] reductase